MCALARNDRGRGGLPRARCALAMTGGGGRISPRACGLVEMTTEDGSSSDTERGSDGSAAGGGYSDLSEWQRSVCNAGVYAKAHTGHRNRTGK